MCRHILNENYIHHGSVTIMVKSMAEQKLQLKCNSCKTEWEESTDNAGKLISCPKDGEPFENKQ